MAVDKLVDSTQLDADLTSVANAIRTKGGTSADLAFPAGFVSAVEAIPTGGGGYTEEDVAKILDGTLTSISNSVVTSLRGAIFKGVSSLLSASFPNLTYAAGDCLQCPNLVSLYIPKLENTNGSGFRGVKVPMFVLPKLKIVNGSGNFSNNSHLTAFDAGPDLSSFANQNVFQNCSALNLLILRRSSSVCSLANVNSFSGTPFASGGSGGTIYIPKSLYDHLGDGTSLDYKAATNWSTINGYGTITWAKIEGSIYETQYADGTPIT